MLIEPAPAAESSHAGGGIREPSGSKPNASVMEKPMTNVAAPMRTSHASRSVCTRSASAGTALGTHAFCRISASAERHLGVLSRSVVDAGDWWAVDGGVVAVMVVEVQPIVQRGDAFSV